ncbi:hypothetical protein [Curtobacterium sp. MCBA15_013]|uniref:hypothetical protein n=1 Tax=Curtobacterium sp. MCBA15_013 TaxID=1898739 RepID=UPI0008DC667B|nr:hypothetical protein [Curtobacterium sp. MCBA15_013]OII28244.1 hypothetical protein BIV01_07640 [Curtobacterium sp. MCBA15_013]
MDWWNDLTDWISSDNGWRVISGALIPFVAIVVAGVIAALIGRGATKRVVAMQEREARNAAVAGIVSAARKAATWGSLGHDERAYADHLAEDADIRLRLLPVAGAPLAANWTQHEIADIKKNSSTFSFQAEQSLAEFRDRILEWQARPNRARKLFKSDLERWKFDSPDPDAELITRQQDWNADQAAPARPTDAGTTTAVPAERPTPTTTSLRPAPANAPAPASTAAAAPGTGAAAAGTTAAPSAGAGFSVTRGGAAPVDPNATTPISDTSSTNRTTPISDTNATNATRAYGDGATRAYGEGATRAYGDGAATPTRAPLGSPASPAGTRGSATESTASGGDTDNADAVDDVRPSSPRGTDRPTTDPRSSGPRGADTTGPDASATPPVAKPTSADAHVNRTTESDARGVDASTTAHTRSIPTRIADGPAEPADANETSEAPYTQPISASELRRRAADDDE